ncbi:MAG TPA: S-adenosylmethionine decarboxylase [Polyangiales bacterium]|jgi:hypothetical protein|nr:S-adenosylmethionine decarboxylase [Polyangiales bacterium]
MSVPQIAKQRLVLEGYPSHAISDADLKGYLRGLSDTIGRSAQIAPVTQRCEQYGLSGWVHWETCNAHVYAWDRPVMLFNVDIWTCKDFSVLEVIEFTRKYFNANRLSYKSY